MLEDSRDGSTAKSKEGPSRTCSVMRKQSGLQAVHDQYVELRAADVLSANRQIPLQKLKGCRQYSVSDRNSQEL